jgi:protein-arginine kinase activator protein McsA
MEWQFKSTAGSEKHQLRLLSKCPRCGARFKVSALWEDEGCQRCRLPFGEECLSESNLSKVKYFS